MGILSNLFKQKSTKATSERPEGRPTSALSAFAGRSPRDTETPGAEATGSPSPAAETVEMQQEARQKNISFGKLKENAAEPAATIPGVKPVTRSLAPVKHQEISEKQISIDFDDVQPQIPAGLLKPAGGGASKAKLLFNTYELLPGLSQGKATAPVTRIAQLAPDLFNGEAPPADSTVELPLKKIVAQIGVFPGRPDQVDEIFPPLDARYAGLVTEKDAPPAMRAAAPEPQPVQEAVAPEAASPSPAPEPQPAPEQTAMAAPAEVPAAEASGNGSTNGNHVEPASGIETVSYSLASIFPNVPESWLDGKLKSVDRAVRIIVPFDLVEVQIASGRVELPFADFFRALPENLKEHFSGDRGGAPAKVLVPLNEVFQNLPGVEPLPPPSPAPVAREPEPEPVEEKIEEKEPALAAPAIEEISAEPEAVAAPLPVEEIHETVASAEPAPDERLPESELLPPLPEPVPVPHAVIPEEAPTAQTENAEEPQPAEAALEPVASGSETQPEAGPPKMEIEPEPAAAHAEPAHTNGNGDLHLITPSIQVLRMAPPPISTRLSFAPEPEQTEAAQPAPAPAPVQQETVAEPEKTTAAAQEPVVATAEPGPAIVSSANIANFIVTDGKLDTRKTVEHVILLPGITAAALIIKGKTRTAGEFPKSLHAYETGKGLFQTFEGHPAKATAAAPRPNAVTLHLDAFSGTWFKQNGIMLCVLHPERALDAATHSAVMLVVQEIVRLRQH
ncbi:MAG TPA: hypothetical protein VG733_10535 [Chthoniobacteraceae bacterium]|nr:hypothetical protein [Chthoniobacteraceae bacterium]